APPPAPFREDRPHELTIVSHSNLFYWWPVWAVCFLFALISYFSSYAMAIMPNRDHAEARRNWRVETSPGHLETREGILLKGDKVPLPPGEKKGGADPPEPEAPRLHVSANKNLGVIFAIVLLLVIIITNVPLRGMWSLVVIIVAIMLSIIFYLADWWV